MAEAVAQSGIAGLVSGLDPAGCDLGLFGKLEKDPGQRVLAEGDRVEIYRPLANDPKEIRKARAAKARQRRQNS